MEITEGTQQQQVYNMLKRDILSGEYEQGRRITEKELIDSTGMKRGPVRESLLILVGEGYVRKIPSNSYIVEGFSDQDKADVCNVRLALEPLAGRLAACHVGREDLIRMQLCLEEEEDFFKRQDEAERVRLDHLFHRQIITASGSKLLSRIYALLSLPVFPDQNTTEEVMKTMGEHRSIFQAIKRGDAGGAEQLIREHLSAGFQLFLAKIEAGQAEAKP